LQELAEERLAAREAVRSLRLAPVMFELGARPHPPRDLYRAYLEQSHIFVGIYWQRYGWVAPDTDVSGIEDELRQHDMRHSAATNWLAAGWFLSRSIRHRPSRDEA
jgi:hypothetical protein